MGYQQGLCFLIQLRVLLLVLTATRRLTCPQSLPC
uniref:Uncharacterized protein n=1 Tax=Rhizophora mucronata TaxID=61149 RepID=A0A2P2R1P5_RHIMU